MQHQLNTFLFKGNPVRVTTASNGETHWVAKDVAEALGYTSLGNMNKLTQHVPAEWKDRKPIPTPSGTQKMVTLTEAGLFFFLNRSDKPAALPLQKWVAGEVLPAIRKTGRYEAQSAPKVQARMSITAGLISHLTGLYGAQEAARILYRAEPGIFPEHAGPQNPSHPAMAFLGMRA